MKKELEELQGDYFGNYFDNISVSFLHNWRVVRASKQTSKKNSFDFFLAGAMYGYNRDNFDGSDCKAAYAFRKIISAWRNWCIRYYFNDCACNMSYGCPGKG